MGGMFSSPKKPDPPPPPIPTPTVDQAAQATEERDKVRRRKGAASTILTQPGSLATAETQTGAKLLGQ